MISKNAYEITDEQIAEIEALASKATHGVWQYHAGEEDPESSWAAQFPIITAEDGEVIGTEGFYSDKERDEANAAHVAATCPSVILALISRLRAAERDAKRYQFLRECGKFSPSAFGGWALNCGYTRTRPSLLDAAIDDAMKGENK